MCRLYILCELANINLRELTALLPLGWLHKSLTSEDEEDYKNGIMIWKIDLWFTCCHRKVSGLNIQGCKVHLVSQGCGFRA